MEHEWASEYFFKISDHQMTCLLCSKVFRLRIDVAKQHFQMFHPDVAAWPEKQKIDKWNELINPPVDVKAASLKISLLVSYHLAKEQKNYGDGLAFLKMFQEALSCYSTLSANQVLQCAHSIPLSRRTLARRVEEISSYILVKLKESIDASAYYSLTLDETVDASGLSQMMVFIRTVSPQFDISEDLLTCCSLKCKPEGIDVYNALNEFFEKNQISFAKMISICTNGSPHMSNSTDGLIGKLLERKLTFSPIHCAINQLHLCAKQIGLGEVVKIVQNIVNIVKKSGRNTVLRKKFKIFLNKYGDQIGEVVHTLEVKLLSKSECLKHFFLLITELKSANIKITETEINKLLNDKNLLARIAFMSDISCIMNTLYSQLQIKNLNILEVINVINEFKNKLKLLEYDLGSLIYFSNCNLFKKQNAEMDFSIFKENINTLQASFNNQFKDFEHLMKYVDAFYYPKICCIADQPEQFKTELTILQTDATLIGQDVRGMEFLKLLYPEKYPILRNEALKLCAMFSTTYQCKAAIGRMRLVKNCQSIHLVNRLNDLLRIAFNNHDIDFDDLLQKYDEDDEQINEPSTSS